MDNSFEYEVNELEEIHGLVEEMLERSESEIYRVLMDHQEQKNAVRGYSEPLRYDDLPETKRGDGGFTWYHDPGKSKCFMMGVPNTGNKNNEEVIETWGSVMQEELEELGYDTIQIEADIYEIGNNDLKQLVGLSAKNPADSTVVRSCWYEDTPEIDELLEADGVDKEEFYNKSKPVPGLYNQLKQKINPEKAPQDFISDESYEKAQEYMYNEKGRRKGACVTGELE